MLGMGESHEDWLTLGRDLIGLFGRRDDRVARPARCVGAGEGGRRAVGEADRSLRSKCAL